jgi:ethanolamine ammonia-lyase small subunit
MDDDRIWSSLRQLTVARIGLKRAGAALATAPLLDFRLAHARARDAVHEPLDDARLMAELAALGHPVLSIASVAEDRQTYLLLPDLGRCLAPTADVALAAHRGGYDVVFVIADGLSARGRQTHPPPGD